MISRRCFLRSSTAFIGLAIAGCGQQEPDIKPPSDLPAGSIDIHAHVFNATDIPVPGFLDQVLIRAPEDPVKGNYTAGALVRLISEIFTFSIKTAKQELKHLPAAGAVPKTEPAVLQEQDKNAIAQGVRRFETRQRSLRAFDTDAAEDAQLLSELGRLANRGFLIRRSAQDLGAAVADAVFETNTSGVMLRALGGQDFDLIQNLRWAALLTRDRRDILAEFIRLYGLQEPEGGGAPVGIAGFSPSIVDFELWFREKPQSNFSSINDQIKVMSRLAYLEQDAVLLNFSPFCPLRAVRERQAGRDWHQVIRKAILSKGFVGVKLYPPMGFKPLENKGGLFGQRFQTTGREIDRELRRMYGWCERHGVPIKAHGNNSLAAQECSGKKAAPDLWASVLDEFPGLHVNIAHFGGFEEDNPTGGCSDTQPSYEERATTLISGRNHAYVDLGYWTEVAGTNRPGKRFVEKVNDLLARNRILASRIMYGSDYSMIGRVRQHGAYLDDLNTAIGKLTGVTKAQILSRNAREYLRLDDPDSATRKRLRRFFPRGHPYFALVNEVP